MQPSPRRIASRYDFSRLASRDFIDVDKRGRGKGSPKGVLKHLAYSIASDLDKDGKVFLRDNHNLIGPALTEQALRGWLWEYLHDEAGYVGEVAEDAGGMKKYDAALRRSDAARKAQIKVESVTSPRTGDKGYRITWTNRR